LSFILKKIIASIIVTFPISISSKFLSLFFIFYRFKSIVTGKRIIFVLDLKRFRQDINILRENTNIYYLNFPYWLQDKVAGLISHSSIKDKEDWLAKFISHLCRAVNSIGFISAGLYYKRHEVWEVSTMKAGRNFYCLHREGVGVDKNMLAHSIKGHLQESRKFKGTKLMVGTESFKNLLVESECISKDKIVVTGMPRFDKIYFETKASDLSLKNGTVLFFSFFVATARNFKQTGSFPVNSGFRKLFDEVHGAAGIYAISHPETKVIIKMKWYEGEAKTNVDNAIKNSTGLDPCEIKNLSIIDDTPAQNLIKQSKVVIGFNSTTLIESILFKKKVVVPLFAEANEEEYSSDVSYYGDMFYKAYSKNDLIKIIRRCYLNNEDNFDFDYPYIEETIGPYDGNICKRISETVK
jgi:hypothetical protein